MTKTECPHPRGAKWKAVVVVGQVIEPLENLNQQASKQVSYRRMPDHLSADHHGMPPRSMQNQNNENGSAEMGSVITDHKVDVEFKDS